MGELHLDIYVERMRREYKVEVEVGQPRVNYREAITRKATYDYLHKKQSGEIHTSFWLELNSNHIQAGCYS